MLKLKKNDHNDKGKSIKEWRKIAILLMEQHYLIIGDGGIILFFFARVASFCWHISIFKIFYLYLNHDIERKKKMIIVNNKLNVFIKQI